MWTNQKGEFHRVDEYGNQDGPAFIHQDGDQYWYLNNQLHRLDGPALIHCEGARLWYLDDEELTQEQWAQDPRVIEFHSRTQEGAEEYLKSL